MKQPMQKSSFYTKRASAFFPHFILLLIFLSLVSCQSDFNDNSHTRPLSKEDSLFIQKYLEPEKTTHSTSTATSPPQKKPSTKPKDQLEKHNIIPPKYPTKGRKYFLSGTKDSLTITLEVERGTPYSIDFKMEIKTAVKWITQKGHASIHPSFNINSTVDAETVGSAAYSTFHQPHNFFSSRDTCFTHIILGKQIGRDKIRGKLIKNCNNVIGDIELDNFPTLIEKNPQ